jgi:hypothetical protein
MDVNWADNIDFGNGDYSGAAIDMMVATPCESKVFRPSLTPKYDSIRWVLLHSE